MAINPTGVQGVQPIRTLQDAPQQPQGDTVTPEQLKQMQDYAKYLMSGGGQQPVKHWTQGVSNMVSALLGGSMDRYAAQREIAAINARRALDPQPIGTQGGPPGAAAPPTAPPAGANPAVSQLGTEAGQPALGFTQTASRSPSAGGGDFYAGGGTKGSYFGNYRGKYNWVDKTDSGLQAGGQPVQAGPGIALPSRKTLGKLFDVITPDGRMFTAKQTDLGPARKTGRGVDINSALAEQMGYTPDRYKGPGQNSFPTDQHFIVRPHVEGVGDQRLLTEGGDGAGGLAGRALAFNGDPVASMFAPSMMPQTGGQPPQAGAQGGGQVPQQAAGGQNPMVQALSGRPAAGGGPAMVPGGAAPGPGLVPARPEISRDQYIKASPLWATPDQQQYFDNSYRMQNMPVPVPGTGGTWYVNPRDPTQRMFVPEIQHRQMEGADFPYTIQPGPQGPVGRPIPMEGGGVPGATQPAPPVDKPFPLIPPKNPKASQFAPDEGPAGLPPEITKGHSEPKVASLAPMVPQSMLTNAPPKAPAPSDQPQQMAQFGGSPQVPTQQGGQRIESMTPDQWFRWKQQREIDTKAAEGYQAADTKGFFDKFEGYQTQAQQAQNLETQISYAKEMAKNWQLRQGPGAQWLTGMDKFLSFFGDKDATQRVTLAQTFEKLTSGTILADMKSKLEGLGQVRLAEIDLLRKAAQAQGNTVGANLAILDLGDRMQKQLQQVGTITRLYYQGVRWNSDGSVRADKSGNPIMDPSKPTQAGMAGAIRMYLSNNPLYQPGEIDREIAEMKEAATKYPGTGVQPQPAGKPAPAKTPTRDELIKQERERRNSLKSQGQ